MSIHWHFHYCIYKCIAIVMVCAMSQEWFNYVYVFMYIELNKHSVLFCSVLPTIRLNSVKATLSISTWNKVVFTRTHIFFFCKFNDVLVLCLFRKNVVTYWQWPQNAFNVSDWPLDNPLDHPNNDNGKQTRTAHLVSHVFI